MDDERFDDLVRRLSVATTRRRTLTGAAVAAAGALGLLGAAGLAGGREAEAKNKGKAKGKHGSGAASVPGSCGGKVCHCPIGNLQNCQSTGDGAGHAGHINDCCCDDPACSCANRGSTCCKPTGASCDNDRQCCNNGHCCNKDAQSGLGVCQTDACCVLKTCAADYAGQCGSFADGCGGTLHCTCGTTGCCDGSGTCQAGDTNAACGTGGGACVSCAAPKTCGGGGTPGVCGCTPACSGKTCGSDSCGGTCGTCSQSQCLTCQADGTCASTCQLGFECKSGTCVPICPHGRPLYCQSPKGQGFKCCPADNCCNYQLDGTVTCGVAGTCPPSA